jgi:hypothetical protein
MCQLWGLPAPDSSGIEAANLAKKHSNPKKMQNSYLKIFSAKFPPGYFFKVSLCHRLWFLHFLQGGN